jgi:UDP-N-acetylmuramoylalanine--D-glutamate ligase
VSAPTVLVVGLAATGRAVARRLVREGATVVGVEEHPEHPGYAGARDELQRLGVRVVEEPTDDALRTLVRDSALVVPSPGVHDRHRVVVGAERAGVPVRSEIDLAGERATVPVVGITGTNGKTTVTSLAAAMLEQSGVRATAAGNIGRPLIEAVDDDVDVLVAELSSFQLRFAPTFSPRVAVLLNLADDHLDWHGSRAAYEDAKTNVFRHQAGDALLVFNADDARVAQLAQGAPGRAVGFTTRTSRPDEFHVDGDRLVEPDGETITTLDAMWSAAPHDVANALAASAAVLDVGATRDGAARAIARFARLHHRAEPVGQSGGVQFVDDSKATNPHATLTAIAGFDSVVLIAGGRNKGLDLGVLREAAPRLRAVVAIGDASCDVEYAFAGAVPVVTARSMRDAVRQATAHARPGDTVLLSPACASFDWYRSYGERGDDFAREVAALIGSKERSA